MSDTTLIVVVTLGHSIFSSYYWYQCVSVGIMFDVRVLCLLRINVAGYVC